MTNETNHKFQNWLKGQETKEFVIKRFRRLGFKVTDKSEVNLKLLQKNLRPAILSYQDLMECFND